MRYRGTSFNQLIVELTPLVTSDYFGDSHSHKRLQDMKFLGKSQL